MSNAPNLPTLLAELEELERESARDNLTDYGSQRRLRLLLNAAPALIAAARRGERLEAALDALARNAYSGSAAGFARAALEEKP